MNERIKQLLEQAGFITTPNTDVIKNKHFGGYMDGRQFEKFAELIVRECEKVAKDGSWYYDAPSCGWRNPINHACNVMKEHFGVEE
jgi:hypothetical protein